MWQIAKFNFFRQINIFLNTLKIKGCSLWHCLRVKIFSYLLFYKIKRTTIQQSTHFNNKYDCNNKDNICRNFVSFSYQIWLVFNITARTDI